MAFLLKTKHFIRRTGARQAGRTTLVTGTSTAVGLALGKISHNTDGGKVKTFAREHGDKAALALGIADSALGMSGIDSAIGDGLAGAGAALLGQRFGFKRFGEGAASSAPVLPAAPAANRGAQKGRRG